MHVGPLMNSRAAHTHKTHMNAGNKKAPACSHVLDQGILLDYKQL